MAIQSQPSRISEPFAGSGTKNVIPATNATPSASQAASWASGFPPECSQPISAGGCPVPRNDMNGVLNWLSQGFSFEQDGGIWEWSALADYDTQRMVRGSDGRLYWSVAQSGPGIAAGVQDPTADNGTYWSTMPMLTPPLADNSSKTATTEWVRDLAVAPVYVDPAGSDSNDGLSAASAVQTFAKALEIGKSMPQGSIRLVVSAGSYAGDVSLDNGLVCIVSLQGDIQITGRISIRNASSLLFDDSGNNPPLSVTVTASNAVNAVFLSRGSVISAQNTNFYLVANNVSNYVVLATEESFFNARLIHISGTSAYGGIHAIAISGVVVNTSLRIDNIITSGAALFADILSRIVLDFDSGDYIHSPNNVANSTTIKASGCSCITINTAFKIYNHATSGFVVYSEECSAVRINAGVNIDSTNCYCFFEVSYSAYLYLNGSLTLSGTVTACLRCSNNATVNMSSSLTASGTVTGKKYIVTRGGQVCTNGGGQNVFPGTNYTVDATQYAYYS